MPNKPPLPLAQAFVVCRTIYEDTRTHDCILVAPFSYHKLPHYPAGLIVSLYAHLTDARGTYHVSLELRDSEDNVGWKWQPAKPFTHVEPLHPHRLVFNDVVLEFTRPGRYQLVLLANGEHLTQHTLELG